MQFYRLVKPLWAQPTIGFGESAKPNPKFEQEIEGPNTFEGCNFAPEFLKKQNELGYNIYWFPNHPSTDVYKTGTKYLNGKSIDVFNYVFVDMDLKDGKYESKEAFLQKLAEFPLPPTLTVDSGNGVHCYWHVEDLTRDMYGITNMALLNYFQTDDSIWTVMQLMRVPGFYNTKKRENYVMAAPIQQLSSGQVYKIEQFPKDIYNHISDEQMIKVRRHMDKLDGKLEMDFGKDANLDELPSKFTALMDKDENIKRMFTDPKSFGDRSAVDMKLANILFNKAFDINEALAVLANTQKALEKGAHRMEYAKTTVSKVYADRPKRKFQTVSQYLADGQDKVLEPPIRGPHYLDYEVLGEPWRRKEILGIIAGSGIGKTAFALNIIKQIIENNPNTDEVYIFFSLEMSKGQVIKRWLQLVGENSPLTDRLYVIDRLDENNKPVNIGLQEMYEYCTEIMQCTGRRIGSIIIDHFHIVSTHINVHKKPNFGIGSEQNTGYGDVQNLSLNGLATQLKSLTQSLDTFTILLSQTTKEKGVGDLPLGKDAAYGVSQYEWIVDRIVTIWQPLMRVQNLTQTRYLAFQYAKIREKRPNDKIMEYDPKLLTYDMNSGNLRITTEQEYQQFIELLPKANEAREAAIKKKANAYSIQINLNGIDEALAKVTGV